jgi:hypothetical protein
MDRYGQFDFACIPKRLDGSGYAWIKAQRGTIYHFGLNLVPTPPDAPFGPPTAAGYRRMTCAPRRMQGGTGYRIAFPDDQAARGYGMCRFFISRHATNETLLVLSEILDRGPHPWLWLLNYDGARLSRTHYMSKRWLLTG